MLALRVFVACTRVNVTFAYCVGPAVENPLPKKLSCDVVEHSVLVLRCRCVWGHTGYR